jgi:hypothetical protein
MGAASQRRLDEMWGGDTTSGQLYTPEMPQPTQAPQQKPEDYWQTPQEQAAGLGFEGFNNQNAWDIDSILGKANDYQAGGGAERAGTRDYIQGQFDDWFQPLAQQYRGLVGVDNSADDDAGLFGSEGFRNFVNTGSTGGGFGDNFGSSPQAAMGQSSFESKNPYSDEIMGWVRGLMPGGGFNQGTVDRRSESARENLLRFQSSRDKNNRAALADRGLIGDGPEMSAMNRLEEQLAGLYGGAVRDIYADESDNADERMMQALGIAGNLNQSEGRNDIDRFLAQTQRDLGFGQLDLDRTLGTGRLALDNYRTGLDDSFRNRGLDAEIENMTTDQLIELLRLYGSGSNVAAGGYF